MKLCVPFSLLLLSFAFTSCSSISREDCSKDMRDFGYEHGRKGMSNLLEDVRKTCQKHEPPVDLARYQTGFEAGWTEYCTPFNGYRMGVKGDLYKSFCPPEREDLFHDRFLIGKKVYDKKDQAKELEEKILDLSEDGKDLTSPSTHDELNRYRTELRDLNKEIQGLEQQGMSNVHIN